MILGTAAYLSPEQVSTGDATPRSDVYSLGVLTYELLTGTTPFTADTPLAVAYATRSDVAAPSAAIDGVPPQFDGLVRRATARDPAARFADAAEMGPPSTPSAPTRPAAVPGAGTAPAPVHPGGPAFGPGDERQSVGRRRRTPAGAGPAHAAKNPRWRCLADRTDWQPAPPALLSRPTRRQGVSLESSWTEFAWARQRSRRMTIVG